MANFKVKDLPWNQKLGIRLLSESQARATGNWGRTFKCIPSDASNWKSATKQPFTRVGRAANYQRYKCGNFEGSVHPDKVKGRAPLADGLSPTKNNPSKLGCLILEAKSSKHEFKDRDKSLYSLETKAGKALSGKNIDRLLKRYPILAAKKGAQYTATTLAPVRAAFQADGEDTSMLEGTITNARDHSTSGIWALVRAQCMMQIGLYEAACVNEEIPYTRFVVIFEREYMRKYFQSIKTPNMKLTRSGFKKNGPTWKNG